MYFICYLLLQGDITPSILTKNQIFELNYYFLCSSYYKNYLKFAEKHPSNISAKLSEQYFKNISHKSPKHNIVPRGRKKHTGGYRKLPSIYLTGQISSF